MIKTVSRGSYEGKKISFDTVIESTTWIKGVVGKDGWRY